MKRVKRKRQTTSPKATLLQIHSQAFDLYRSHGAKAALDYVQRVDVRSLDKTLREADLALDFVKLVSRQSPMTGLDLLSAWIEQNPNRHDGRVLQSSLLDRTGDRKAARDSAVSVINAEDVNPEHILSACNLLVRLEDDTRALLAAKKAYYQLDRPLNRANALLYIALNAADWQTVSELTKQLQDAHAAGRFTDTRETPRTHLLWCDDESSNIAMLKAWSKRHLQLPLDVTRPVSDPLQGRRLRIGYLSSDFRKHPTSRLINGLLRHHDHELVELFMYCSGWDDGSAMRREVESHFDHIHELTQLSDADAASLIRSHKIDVLVELNGPTRANRMGILAFRPAPVQVDYLGWPGSVGGRVVDYVLGDPYTIPAGAEELYPEKVVRIQRTYQVNDYASRTLLPKPTRSQLGLPDDCLVLGMFNAINKVRSDVWGVWMTILKSEPKAILWILDPGVAARKFLGLWTRQFGVDPSRIVAAPRVTQDAHLARMQCCDLMLDPWPYGGHTSTSDALFAGVPVIALEGKNFAGRVSGSLLKAAGLETFVQPTPKAYALAAINMLKNPQELSRLHCFVREKVPLTDIFNAKSKARQFEVFYRTAAERALSELPLVHMNFPD